MNLHRVKHIPSGLYYQPGENNFSEKGKVYQNNQDVLVGDAKYIGISMTKTSKLVKKYSNFFENWDDELGFYGKRIFKRFPKEEFIREQIEIK